MKRIIFITISILCAVVLQAQDTGQFADRQMQSYPKPQLLGIQPLDAAAMPLIFRKQQ